MMMSNEILSVYPLRGANHLKPRISSALAAVCLNKQIQIQVSNYSQLGRT